MEFGQGLALRFEREGQPRTCGFHRKRREFREKNKTKNTSFNSVFQNPCCVRGLRRLCFVPVEILPTVGLCYRDLGVFF